MKLDKFYTNPDVAKQIASKFLEMCHQLVDVKECTFLEPAAGNGVLYNLLPSPKLAIDISPDFEDCIEADFLKYDLDINKKYLTLMNPPFGRQYGLGVKFFNRCAIYSDVIGTIAMKLIWGKGYITFVMPPPGFKLVYQLDLPADSFTPPQSSAVCFQVWTRAHTKLPNLRTFYYPQRPPEFDVWTCTSPRDSEKFQKDADFYMNRKFFTPPEPLFNLEELRQTIKTQQYAVVMFKAHTPRALDNLLKIDYAKIGRSNYSVRRYGLTVRDILVEYERLYGEAVRKQTSIF